MSNNKSSGFFNLLLIAIIVFGLTYIHENPKEVAPVPESTKAEISHIFFELGESFEFAVDKILSLFGYEKEEPEVNEDVSANEPVLGKPVEDKIGFLDIISDWLGGINLDDAEKVVDIDDMLNAGSTEFEPVYLNHVVDGDTFIATDSNNEEIKVRLIGIDTPESVHSDESRNNEYGTMASDNTKNILKDVSVLYLQYDLDKEDQYGRVLAYAWLTEEVDSENIEDIQNYMLNGIILSQGYAVDKVYQPNDMYADEFATICDNAEENNTGLWQYEEYRNLVNQ